MPPESPGHQLGLLASSDSLDHLDDIDTEQCSSGTSSSASEGSASGSDNSDSSASCNGRSESCDNRNSNNVSSSPSESDTSRQAGSQTAGQPLGDDGPPSAADSGDEDSLNVGLVYDGNSDVDARSESSYHSAAPAHTLNAAEDDPAELEAQAFAGVDPGSPSRPELGNLTHPDCDPDDPRLCGNDGGKRRRCVATGCRAWGGCHGGCDGHYIYNCCITAP